MVHVLLTLCRYIMPLCLLTSLFRWIQLSLICPSNLLMAMPSLSLYLTPPSYGLPQVWASSTGDWASKQPLPGAVLKPKGVCMDMFKPDYHIYTPSKTSNLEKVTNFYGTCLYTVCTTKMHTRKPLYNCKVNFIQTITVAGFAEFLQKTSSSSTSYTRTKAAVYFGS